MYQAIRNVIGAISACLLTAAASAQDTGANENTTAAAPAVTAEVTLTPSAGERRFLDAREAIRTGDRATLERLAGEIDGHPLDGYVRYWLLFNKLARPEKPQTNELVEFLVSEAGSLLAERLRADWLRRLAKDGDWALLLQLYPNLQEPDAELRCFAWQARMNRGEAAAVAGEISRQWQTLTHIPPPCDPILRHAIAQGVVTNEDIWRRFRGQIDTRQPERARATLAWVDAASIAAFDQMLKKPVRYLDRLPANFATARGARELALAAIIRMARADIPAAHKRLLQIAPRLSESERAHAWAVLALHAAQSQMPEAPAWFRAAGNAPLNMEQRAWRVRASLRAEDWPAVLDAINRMPPEEHQITTWSYWRGRALAATGKHAEAQIEFARIANDPGFYGILASEELGRPLWPLPPTPTPAAHNGGQEAENDMGLQRALALFRLDLRIEGVREWNWALRGRNESFRIAAARLALKHQLYDRAINSAELANPTGAYELRFLTPYRDLIEPNARGKGLDLSWVYGVMRQESRFIVPARSSSGAQGLMQIMPATGKWLARKIGLDYHPDLLTNPDTNVHLGTHYMRIMLDELNNHPVLASAGYNAGPGRARRWRDTRPLEGAIYAETIPFDETRDYVKKVMANTVIYAALLEGRPQSLKARLGTIAPRG
ncbi:MAG: lytic transglycosylase domain-containing protein [Azoarcus sp.]|jgi:soluble lytic murein transglycosylase|nr:lytic transglycosylase domain-containing protein [Azoarcus sp.]